MDEPDVLVTHERDVAPVVMPDTDGAWSTTRFVPIDDLRHDMHVNIVNFGPGGAIPFPETHVMEHGLYVLEGKAVYLLNTDWVEVEAGDFMWLRAFCPQACYAGGPGSVPVPALQGRQPARAPGALTGQSGRAGHRLSRPSSLLQEEGYSGCRGTRAVEDLAPAETHRDAAGHDRIQVALEFAVSLTGGVVEQPAVQLDLEVVVGVRRVGVPHPFDPATGIDGCASGSPWARSTRASVLAFEHRVRPRPDVRDHLA